MGYWSAHTHSKYSAKDALPSVEVLVERAADLEMPAIGLTDHGTLGGSHELYRSAKKHGLMAVPGCEMYVSVDRTATDRPVTKHLGVVATTSVGWENLVNLVNHSMKVYRYKPLVDFDDLARLSRAGLLRGLAVMTGCFFGVVPGALVNGALTALNLVRTLQKYFDGRVYVEVQNHRTDPNGVLDSAAVRKLANLADMAGAPMVVTNDAHYALPSHQDVHNTLKYIASWSDSPDDALFPGDGYWLCSEETMRSRFTEDVWNAGVAGLEDMLAQYDLSIPELDTYKARVPKIAPKPDMVLQQRCDQALADLGLQNSPAYRERLMHEMEVYSKTGFSDYILLVAQITDYMREQGIVFIARGSASGSLVCWLCGITDVDPMHYNLLFARFMSADRIRPPDIDLDVQHDRRKEVMDWLRTKFPCTVIGTWRELKLNPNDPHKGSLWDRWVSASKKHNTPAKTPKSDALLARLSSFTPFESAGVHTAGMIVAPSTVDLANVPLQWIANSKTMVSALDGDSVEAAGLVKVDLLGVQHLTAMARVFKELDMEFDDVPLNDRKVFARMRTGVLAGAFQLSGWTASRGCKRLRPKRFEDVVLAMGLFRPAVMNSGVTDAYLQARSTGAKDMNHHPVIAKHTSATKGFALFQEQLISIVRDLGMGPEELQKFLKAVKSSNAKTEGAQDYMRKVVNTLRRLGEANDLPESDIEWLVDAAKGYAEYGFPRAHAVAYARIAYLSVWLLVHHPAKFWAALMSCKEKMETLTEMRAAARSGDGVVFIKPHVNHSKVEWTAIDNKVIYTALRSIPKVGDKAAVEIVAKAPFTSVEDMCTRCDKRVVSGARAFLKGAALDEATTVVAALDKAGALDGLPLYEKDRKSSDAMEDAG